MTGGGEGGASAAGGTDAAVGAGRASRTKITARPPRMASRPSVSGPGATPAICSDAVAMIARPLQKLRLRSVLDWSVKRRDCVAEEGEEGDMGRPFVILDCGLWIPAAVGLAERLSVMAVRERDSIAIAEAVRGARERR